ncbi:MAG: SDR family oxidoreductase [Myxococcota bacterium]
MDLGLTDKVVLVTGASSGIGRAIAAGFWTEGALVVGHAFSGHEALTEWGDTLGIDALQADLRDPAQAEELVAQVVDEYERIDVVVANAGRWPEPELLLDETSPEALRAAIEDNLWTSMMTARALFGALRRLGPSEAGASLVFTGSTAGRFGEAGHVAYAAAKAGLHGLVATLKNEIVALDPRGRVNGVQPGWTRTPAVASAIDEAMVARVTRTMPLRQLAEPEDVARAAVWLGSPAARHVTGEWITVAGGMEGRILWPDAAPSR